MEQIELKKANLTDLNRIRNLYWKLIDSMDENSQFLRWKKEIYPADADWIHYINREEMFLIVREDELLGAVVITEVQSESYKKFTWITDAKDHEVYVIHLLAVDPECQGQGIASKALDEIVNMGRRNNKKTIRLDAITTNQPARKFYEKYGFANCGVNKEYYESTGWAEFIFYELLLEIK